MTGTLVPMHPRPFRSARASLAAFVVAATSVVGPGSASAHTDFDFSIPSDGASIDEPVGEITVAYTEPVTLVGNGFEVLDPHGNITEPPVTTDDNIVFRLQMDPPLAGGAVGVRYEVTSEDGHVVSGGFSFAVAAEPPTDTTATTPDPVTTEPEPSAAAPSEPADPAQPSTPLSPPPEPTEPPVGSATDQSAAASVASDVDGTDDADQAAADGGGSTAGYIALAALVAAVAAGFLVFRSRSSG